MPEPYSAYAAIYDLLGQGAFAEQMVARTLAWLAPRAALRVLDLACGTGAASLAFAAAGHRVVGVDRSTAMLRLAEGKAQRAGLPVAFVPGDIRTLAASLATAEASRPVAPFDLFDLVVCFFDSVNYLTGSDDLRLLCAEVAAALRPEGTFVFDLNTEAEFATWDERDEVVYDDASLLVYNRLNYHYERRLATGRVVWFTRELDRWWREEETHVERAWSTNEVRDALEGAGLRLVARLTPTGQLATEHSTRVVYYAQRNA